MFFPHFASINTKRQAPGVVTNRMSAKLRERNEDFVTGIVMNSWLRGDFAKSKKSVEKKISDISEIEIRSESARDFMEKWNFWRKFYFDLSPISPKTKSQLTQIEKIVLLSKSEDLRLTMLIGTVHKAFVWRKVNPGFQDILFKGLEYYERFHDIVISDIDSSNYMENAKDG